MPSKCQAQAAGGGISVTMVVRAREGSLSISSFPLPSLWWDWEKSSILLTRIKLDLIITPKWWTTVILVNIRVFRPPNLCWENSSPDMSVPPQHKAWEQASPGTLAAGGRQVTEVLSSHAPWTNFPLEASDPQRQGTTWAPLWQRWCREPLSLQKEHRPGPCPAMRWVCFLIPHGGWGIGTC